MTIKLEKISSNKNNQYKVVYKGDWNDGDYIYEFEYLKEKDFWKLIMMLDFYEKRDELENHFKHDIRTDVIECAENYFEKWFLENGFEISAEHDPTAVAEYFDEELDCLPFESSSGYGIHSLEITLEKNNEKYKLSYTKEDVDEVIENYLINLGYI